VDRTDQGLTPRFVKVEPPNDADIADVVETISHRVIRTPRRLGSLEAGIDAAVATGSDPLGEDEPELARPMAASVQQRMACGARAGQKVRRMGSGLGYAGERPARTGTRCASVHGFALHANVSVPAPRRDQWERLIRSTARGAVSLERLEADANGALLSTFTRPWSDGTIGSTLAPLERLEKLAALGPLPRMHRVRYGGCRAPPSQLRRLLTPTPRQRGVEAPEAGSTSPRWGWARLLKRVVACDLEPCPACGRGTLRLIATLTQADVLRTMRRPLTRAAEPPPLAEARVGQATCAWASPEPDSAFSHVPWGPVVAAGRPRRVPPAASGEHERVRDVSQVRRRGGSGQRGGF
jgi:hypothetical protein